jgi:hypothetical protein
MTLAAAGNALIAEKHQKESGCARISCANRMQHHRILNEPTSPQTFSETLYQPTFIRRNDND